MYACFAFFPDGTVKRWKYVTNLDSFKEFLNKSHPSWKYFNVYDKGTKDYLKRIYPGNANTKVLAALMYFFVLLSSYENTFNKTTFNKTTFINGFNNTATISTTLNPKGGLKWLS